MQGFVELYSERRAPPFIGYNLDYRDAKAVILGIPYDSGSTYVPGCRLAPPTIREVSHNLETFDPPIRSGCDRAPYSRHRRCPGDIES
ncbi:MAG TPA: hypothetical protein ENG30_01095 [Thermofilaceae archaeon]|nr:hypothetical protein [Thermofilaceae archaeon]